MNLVIDIGNSSAKIGCFSDDPTRTTYRRITHAELRPVAEALQPRHILISSVAGDAQAWKVALAGITDTILLLDHQLPLPFVNHYQTPHTLGTDRLAAVAGAQALYPGQSCLVIDAGTCIKYEWLENGTDYQGGSISPGLRMRFQAMHTFTSRLPLVEPDSNVPLTGTSTQTALQSGVLYGMLAEMEGISNRYRTTIPGLLVILCGGDAHFFERRLKTPIFAVSELVLIGLNHILNFNLKASNVADLRPGAAD